MYSFCLLRKRKFCNPSICSAATILRSLEFKPSLPTCASANIFFLELSVVLFTRKVNLKVSHNICKKCIRLPLLMASIESIHDYYNIYYATCWFNINPLFVKFYSNKSMIVLARSCIQLICYYHMKQYRNPSQFHNKQNRDRKDIKL
jgi:hypothetical protein